MPTKADEVEKTVCPECGAQLIKIGGDCYQCGICGRKC